MTLPDMPAEVGPHDPRALERLRRWGGETLLREMVDLYLRDVPSRLATARHALAQDERREYERVVHSLKSSGAQLGGVRLQQLAREAEEAAALADATTLAALLARLDSAFADHAAWLRRAAAGSTP